MDTTPPKKQPTTYKARETPLRQVRVLTVGDEVTVVTRIRSQHTRGITEHRYPLTLLDAAMLAAELNDHVHKAYDRERNRRDAQILAPGA